jgi:hypothetical protein
MFNIVGSFYHYESNFYEHQEILMAGGRSNSKKYHLVIWKTVRSLKDRGGIGIKDLVTMNVVMGVKLIWKKVTSKIEWWNNILWKK